jgi:Na+-driven multidrug efflux pump
LPLGFQALTEWGNMFLLSTLIARKGGNASMAANGSFQIITAATLITAALGQGISIKISEQLGKMKIAEQLKHFNEIEVINRNLKRLGNAGIATGALATTGLMAFLVSMPKQIQSIFVSQDDPDYQEIMIMAQSMLIINAVGLIFDTVRNMSASALGGSKDVIFAPIISMLTMSMMALSFGALLTEHWNLDANWLFITRDVGILAAAFAVSIKWLMKNHMPQPETKSTVKIEELPSAPASPKLVQKIINYGSNGSTFFHHKDKPDEQKYLFENEFGHN